MYLIKDNIERMFDFTLKKAMPYLFLAPPHFRNKIAEQMNGLFHDYRTGDDGTFLERNETINKMIDEADFDSGFMNVVHAFESKNMNYDDRINTLNGRLAKLEKAFKGKRKDPAESPGENLVEILPFGRGGAHATFPKALIGRKIKYDVQET